MLEGRQPCDGCTQIANTDSIDFRSDSGCMQDSSPDLDEGVALERCASSACGVPCSEVNELSIQVVGRLAAPSVLECHVVSTS